MTYFLLDEHKVSSEDFDGEMVAVNFSTGKYYGMKGSAHDIWRMLSFPVSTDEIMSGICQMYGTEKADIQDAVMSFFEVLRAEDILMEVADRDTDGQMRSVGGPAVRTYEAPELEVYSDLQELIMLDPVHEADPEQGWPQRRQAEDG